MLLIAFAKSVNILSCSLSAQNVRANSMKEAQKKKKKKKKKQTEKNKPANTSNIHSPPSQAQFQQPHFQPIPQPLKAYPATKPSNTPSPPQYSDNPPPFASTHHHPSPHYHPHINNYTSHHRHYISYHTLPHPATH